MNTENSIKEKNNSVKSTLIKNLTNKLSKKSYIDTEQCINLLNYKKITEFINVIICGLYVLNKESMKNNESFINFMTSEDKKTISDRRKIELALYSKVIQKFILHSENINKPLKNGENPKAIMEDGTDIYGMKFIEKEKINRSSYIPILNTNIKPQSLITKDISQSILYSSIVESFSEVWDRILISYNYLENNSNSTKIKHIIETIKNSYLSKYINVKDFEDYLEKIIIAETEKKNKNTDSNNKLKSKSKKSDKEDIIIDNTEEKDKVVETEREEKNISFVYSFDETIDKNIERINIKNRIIIFNKKVIDFCKSFITNKVKENKIDISSVFIEHPTEDQLNKYNFGKLKIILTEDEKTEITEKFNQEYRSIIEDSVKLGKDTEIKTNNVSFSISNTFFKNYIKHPSLDILKERTNNSSIVNKINYNFTLLNEAIFKYGVDKFINNVDKFLSIKSKMSTYKKMVDTKIIYDIIPISKNSDKKNKNQPEESMVQLEDVTEDLTNDFDDGF